MFCLESTEVYLKEVRCFAFPEPALSKKCFVFFSYIPTPTAPFFLTSCPVSRGMVQDAEGEGTPCEDLFIYNRRQQKGQLHTSHQENDQESRSFMLYLTRNH